VLGGLDVGGTPLVNGLPVAKKWSAGIDANWSFFDQGICDSELRLYCVPAARRVMDGVVTDRGRYSSQFSAAAWRVHLPAAAAAW